MNRVRSTLNNMNLPNIGALALKSIMGGSEILGLKLDFAHTREAHLTIKSRRYILVVMTEADTTELAPHCKEVIVI
jgi:hypothetical protein